jgi:hypothetical protein
VTDLRKAAHREKLQIIDALVVADYRRDDWIVGAGGDITVQDLAEAAPTVAVLQFAGRVDAAGLVDQGLVVYPSHEVGARRMGQTLAELGPRPVIELHTAGLKVGETAARARRCGLDAAAAEAEVLRTSALAQPLRSVSPTQ